MDATPDWSQRIRSALTGANRLPDDDVVEELAQHARAMYEAARADGTSSTEAGRRVDLQIALWAHDADVLKHRPRRRPVEVPLPTPSGSWGAGLIYDIRYAWRLFHRQATFTLLVVATMALGIGATTTLFSLTYGVLLKPLPWPNSDRLVSIEETRGGNRPRFNSFSNTAYLAWNEGASTVDELAAWAPRIVTLTGAGDPERIRIVAATASLFSALGVRPMLGSLFEETDETAKDGQVVVLSERLWTQRFAADPRVLGRLMHLDGQGYRVIGVVRDAQAYPNRETLAWVPFRVPPATGNLLSMFSAIAKLRPGATPVQAAAEGTARGRFAADTGLTTMAIFGGNGPVEISARPLADAITATIRRPLLVLLVAVALLLVTATANVASLQLARATTRRRELALRAALGAEGGRITRQLLIENVVLGLAGGVTGLAVAAFLHRYLPSILPADFPRVEDVGLNAIVVAFAAAVSALAGMAFGMSPVLRARRINLIESLAEDQSAPIEAGRSRIARTRAAIMTGQVSIACVLLVGGSLLGRSFVALINADRGYDPSGLLTARLSLPAPAYTPERRYAILRQVLDRLAAAPGVIEAAFTSEQPLTPGGSTRAFQLRSRAVDGGTVSVQASPRIVGPGVFNALRMRVVAGRGFDDSDTETSLPAVVVNQAFVRRYLGDQPLGARLPMGYQREGVEATVIGVVDDIRYLTANDSSLPEMYYSYRQFGGALQVGVVTLLVRTHGDPASLAGFVRVAVREADDGLVPESVMTMEDRVLTSLARPRLYAILLGGFAMFALAVAAVGLFAVLWYTVGQRSRELAVRAALGARQAEIVRLVVGQGLAVTAVGIVIGIAGSLLLARALGALLYGVEPHDPLTYVAVSVALLLVAAVACIGPARRAAQLDPWRLLKSG